MGDDPSRYVGKITMSGSNKSDMISFIGEINNLIINDDRVDNFGVVCLDIRTLGGVCLELGLVRSQLNMVMSTVLEREMEEILERENIV